MDFKQRNKKIAEETIAITERGWYRLKTNKIKLPVGNYEDVITITPSEAANCEKKAKPVVSDENYHNIWVFDVSPYAVADEEGWLIMNFANPYTPGNGFNEGYNGQEQCLCRQSTLYNSIGSEAASKMYKYNKKNQSATYSDYMLISPDVCVFRDSNDKLLENPFKTSIITVPALNLKNEARYLAPQKIEEAMKSRLRKMFAVLYKYQYYSIVLGAWGCGGFGHDPYDVARYFYEVLVDEGYDTLFNVVAFAIPSNYNSENFKAFAEVFKDVDKAQEDSNSSSSSQNDPPFYQANYPMPACNFSTENVDEHNLGYAYGVLKTGCPFVAELWKGEDDENIMFYLPVIEEFIKLADKPLINEATGTKVFSYEKESKSYWILDIGLTFHGSIEDISVLNAYVQFMEKNGLIKFTSNLLNGYASMLTDLYGNSIIGFNVTLKSEMGEEATSQIKWTPFPQKPTKPKGLTVIK